MSSKVVSFRLSERVINFLRGNKFFETTYDEITNKIMDECEKTIDRIDDYNVETLTIQTFKLSDETIRRLDMIAKKYDTTRSKVFRKLVLAKAEGLC